MSLQVDNTNSKSVLMNNYIIQYIQYEMPWIQLPSHTLHKKSEVTYNILFCSQRQLIMTLRQCFSYTTWQRTHEPKAVVTVCTRPGQDQGKQMPSTENLSTNSYPCIRSYWKFIDAVTGRANISYDLKNIILQCTDTTQK